MGVVHILEIRLWWSNDPMYINLLTTQTMRRDRFLDILKYWHFSNNSEISPAIAYIR